MNLGIFEVCEAMFLVGFVPSLALSMLLALINFLIKTDWDSFFKKPQDELEGFILIFLLMAITSGIICLGMVVIIIGMFINSL